MTIRRSYVDTRFGQAHLRVAGPDAPTTASPLLCLPPQPMSGRALEPLLAALGRTRHVIAVDLPGFGQSAGPTAPPGLDDYLGWVLDVADAAALPSFAALGWLTGGRFVVPLAARHPQRVSRLVMLGAPTPSAAQRAVSPPPTLPPPQRDGSHLQSEWARWMGWWPEDSPLQEAADQFADTIVGLGRAERSWLTQVSHSVLYEEWLPRLEQPVLVINPSGPMHDATARVAPWLRHGRVVDTAVAMFPLLSTAHVDEARDLITAFLDSDV
jgi:pimeloyl-ACP methyl ester carboxylesterase